MRMLGSTMEKSGSTQAEQTSHDTHMDQAITDLPPGSEILSVTPTGPKKVHSTSISQDICAAPVKVIVKLPDSGKVELFIKGAFGAVGMNMMKGAFEAEKALYSFIPDRVPRPIVWGTYVADADTHFYMSDFVKMEDSLPSPRGWAKAVSTLHMSSIGQSPTGRFGFHVTTHLANVPINNEWKSSWEEFWAQQMRGLFDQEEKAHEERDDELEALKSTFLDRAVPRYLRPLESDGRSIQPCLVHSDLWPGNIKPRSATGDLCLFDACAYWGHNEADLGICRNPRYKLGPPCIKEYLKRVPVSEPAADFDGRNAVYAMKFHALLSVMYSKNPLFRSTLKSELTAVMKMIKPSIPRSAKFASRL